MSSSSRFAPIAQPPQSPWVRWVATWFGCGYSRLAPGTVGSLGALPLYFLLTAVGALLDGAAWPSVGWVSAAFYWASVALVSAVGTAAAGRYAQHAGTGDPQQVVVDEVAGVLIALGLVHAQGPLALATAWVLFRALDILKPWPVSLAERAKPVGVGIMLDDAVAGAAAGIAALLIF